MTLMSSYKKKFPHQSKQLLDLSTERFSWKDSEKIFSEAEEIANSKIGATK